MQNSDEKPVHSPSSDYCLAEASALYMAGELGKAEAVAKTLLTTYPENIHALNLLAVIYARHGKTQESLDLFAKTIAINPHHADAYNNSAIILYDLKRYNEALENYNKAIAINPNLDITYNNRANTLADLRRYSEAVEDYDRAIAINPVFYMAYNNRGVALTALGKYDEALESYDKAISINASYASTYHNKGLLKLLLGEYEEGWKLYEQRWNRNNIASAEIRHFKEPLWLGKEKLVGKTILLHAEQGLGDTIQFCRYVSMVEALGADIILEVQPSLVGLVSGIGKSLRVIARGSPLPDFDFHCPLLSLPLAFGTTLSTIPSKIPYLFADPERQKIWQQRLGIKSRPRIGLVWSGTAHFRLHHDRSVDFALLAPLLELGFEFHSLQKEVRRKDQAAVGSSNVFSHANELTDFSDTAALIAEMDLVISIDTSVAHLAGALGKNTWLLIHNSADFRWLIQREDSPWYPTAKLFRQKSVGDWKEVIARVKNELSVYLPKRE